MRLLYETKVAQCVTPRRIGWFHKELLRVDADVPVVVTVKRAVDREPIAPVILVHGFGQNRYAWHLPTRSFANHLAHSGFAVFNVDLRGHGRSRELGGEETRSSGIDDYIRGDLPAVIAGVLERTGFAKAFLVGHSLGGLCSAAAAALLPSRVAGVVSIGSPHALGRGHLVLGNLLRMAGNTVGASGILRSSRRKFPMDLLGKAVHATQLAWNSDLAPIPVRAWKPGTFSPRELRQFMRSFDSASFGTVHDLMELAATGDLRSRLDGQSYTKLIEQSTLPLLAVCGTKDLLANPGSVKPLYENSRSNDKGYVKVDAGHSDLLIGKQAPELVWPIVTGWMERRQALATVADDAGEPTRELPRIPPAAADEDSDVLPLFKAS